MKSDQLEECILCCREINIYAIGKCDHPVCYLCFTRLKVLCEINYCTICRKENEIAIFTKSCRPFLEIQNKFTLFNKKYKIIFEDKSVQVAFEKVLENKCEKCEMTFDTFQKLQEHVRKDHELFYCELCNENLKMFPFEKRYYDRKELATHKRLGDKDDTSQRGHPLCEFCDRRYMDKDDLFRHLRKDHFFCHFCDVDGLHQYYNDYEYLRSHFRAEHYLCEEDECIHEQFTSAFRSEIDLKAHAAVQHSKNKSKAEAKQARVLDFEFSYAPSARPNGSSSPRGGRYGPGRRRNADESSSQSQVKPPPEVEKPNTTSVQDFPFLSENNAKKSNVPDLTLNYSSIQSQNKNYAAAPKRNAMSSEEFPALCPTSVPSSSGSSNKSSSSKQASNSLARNPFALSQKTIPDKNGNTYAQIKKEPQSNNKSKHQETKWLGKKNINLEDEFPSLSIGSGRQQSVSAKKVTAPKKAPDRNIVEDRIPMDTRPPVVPEKPSNSVSTTRDRFVVIKTKSKKKKNKEYVPPEPETVGNNKFSNGCIGEDEDVDVISRSKNCKVHAKLRPKQKVYTETDPWRESASFGTADFPPLAPAEPVRRPPGFNAPKPKGPPPGFTSSTTSTISDPSIALKTLSEIARETIRLDPKPTPMEEVVEPPEEKIFYSFIPPPHAASRNDELKVKIASLSELNNPRVLEDFTVMSRQFRFDAITADIYHDKCLEIFKSRYLDIFPELVCLLPDIGKQRELFAVHTHFLSRGVRAKKSSTASPLVTCDGCGQVLLKSDCKSHEADHAKSRCQ